MSLLNKVVAVTGGARGIGKIIAERLLREGARIIVADIDVDRGEQFQRDTIVKLGENKLKFIKCNAMERKELNDMFDMAKSWFGQLDIVCNNVGVMINDPREAHDISGINLTATMQGTYKGISLMSKRNGALGGAIVNISSIDRLKVLPEVPSAYTASKTSLIAFTRSFGLFRHHIDDGVRVNCICPTFCETNMPKEQLEGNIAAAELFQQAGMVDSDEVVEAFMTCILSEEMNGKVISVRPQEIPEA